MDNTDGIGATYANIGNLRMYELKYYDAILALEKSMEIWESLDRQWSIGFTKNLIATCHFGLGNYTDAIKLTREAYEIYNQFDYPMRPDIPALLGAALVATEQFEEAARWLYEGIVEAQAVMLPYDTTVVASAVALYALSQGDYAIAGRVAGYNTQTSDADEYALVLALWVHPVKKTVHPYRRRMDVKPGYQQGKTDTMNNLLAFLHDYLQSTTP
jgi:tetratricopeptide (TPR) repeat protein